MPVATQIQRLVIFIRKDVGALLAYPTCGLSHCLAQDKQLDSPRRDILTKPQWAGYNTPKVDVLAAYLLG